MRHFAIFLSTILMLNFFTQASFHRNETNMQQNKTMSNIINSSIPLIDAEGRGCHFKNETGRYRYKVPCKEVIPFESEVIGPPF
ncbi:UNVERIFIED_CONTAM: hypothetical protein RMT77_001085 [Armadillidium vulgare]